MRSRTTCSSHNERYWSLALATLEGREVELTPQKTEGAKTAEKHSLGGEKSWQSTNSRCEIESAQSDSSGSSGRVAEERTSVSSSSACRRMVRRILISRSEINPAEMGERTEPTVTMAQTKKRADSKAEKRLSCEEEGRRPSEAHSPACGLLAPKQRNSTATVSMMVALIRTTESSTLSCAETEAHIAHAPRHSPRSCRSPQSSLLRAEMASSSAKAACDLWFCSSWLTSSRARLRSGG